MSPKKGRASPRGTLYSRDNYVDTPHLYLGQGTYVDKHNPGQISHFGFEWEPITIEHLSILSIFQLSSYFGEMEKGHEMAPEIKQFFELRKDWLYAARAILKRGLISFKMVHGQNMYVLPIKNRVITFEDGLVKQNRDLTHDDLLDLSPEDFIRYYDTYGMTEQAYMSDWHRETYRRLMDRAHYCKHCDSVYYTWVQDVHSSVYECKCPIPNSHAFRPLEKDWGRLYMLEGQGHKDPFYYFLENYDVVWSTEVQSPYLKWNYRTHRYESEALQRLSKLLSMY